MAQAEVETQSPPAAAAGPRDAARSGAGAGSPPAAEQAPQRKPMSPRTRLLAIAAVVVLVIGGTLYWLHSRQFEDTDDAQVDGHIHPISARISGTVKAIGPEVRENQYVAAGTVLVDIDPADLQAEVARAQAEVDRLQANAAVSGADLPVQTANATGQLQVAEAAVAEARQGVDGAIASLEAAKARVTQSQANATRAANDRDRYAKLLDKQEVSRSEFDQRDTDARTAKATLDGAAADSVGAAAKVAQSRAMLAQQEANLSKARTAPQQIAESKARLGSANADLARAQAQLETAKLNLSYTRIVAPVSGIIGRKGVEVGQRLQPGQEMLTIVQTDDVWVTANFKETQLRLMRAGEPAEVHVDAYGMDFSGKVESIAPATGARFSLLPPENATGNFVKVVQRMPVRIRLDHPNDPQHPLRPGMSVDATVTVR